VKIRGQKQVQYGLDAHATSHNAMDTAPGEKVPGRQKDDPEG
jgi:hypothetical protein